MKKTNEEECTKYADVECKYKMQKDETLTKYYKEEPKILYPSLTLVRENNELDIEISSFFIIIYCVLLTYYDIM